MVYSNGWNEKMKQSDKKLVHFLHKKTQHTLSSRVEFFIFKIIPA